MKYKIINNNKKRNLLILHCICGNTNIFKEQFPILSKKYNFILLDLPAHGESLDYTDNFNFEIIANNILHILQSNNLKNIDILSISMGAMITEILIKKSPKNLINKVVFTSTIIGFPIRIMDYMFHFFVKLFDIFPRFLCMHFITHTMLPFKFNKSQRNKLYKYSLIMNKKALKKYLKQMSNFIINHKDFSSTSLKNYCNDYIYINGELDRLFLPKLRKHIDTKHLITIKGASHLCNIDKSTEFNNILCRFLI